MLKLAWKSCKIVYASFCDKIALKQLPGIIRELKWVSFTGI